MWDRKKINFHHNCVGDLYPNNKKYIKSFIDFMIKGIIILNLKINFIVSIFTSIAMYKLLLTKVGFKYLEVYRLLTVRTTPLLQVTSA